MKRVASRTVVALAAVATLALGVPAMASADSAPTTTTTITATTTTAGSLSAWRAFRLTWRAYVDGLRSINLSYRSAVATARGVLGNALAASTSQAERQADRTTYRASVAAALTTRDAAITAWGSPPSPPPGFTRSAYVMGFQAANEAYRTAVVAAQTAFAASIVAATTPGQRTIARDQLKLSIAEAAETRALALTALGPPPANPGK